MATTARPPDHALGNLSGLHLPGVTGLQLDAENPRVWTGWMDRTPVRALVVHGGAVAVDPVAEAIEHLRPATDHPFASRIHGCYRVEANVLVVVTDHHPLGTVERVVAISGPTTPAEALSLAADVAEAVARCHAAGFVHGHIGPATIRLGEDRHPRLGSHGALGEVEAGLGVIRTPAGITPPEGRPSAAGDIYALALSAIFVATGAADPRYMPPDWAMLLGAALLPDPAMRPHDAAAFAATLRAAAGPRVTVDDLQLNKVPRSTKSATSKIGAGAVLVVGGLAAWSLASGSGGDRPKLGPPVTSASPSTVPTASAGPAASVATSPAPVSQTSAPGSTVAPASSAPQPTVATTVPVPATVAPPTTAATTPTTAVRPSSPTVRRTTTTVSAAPSTSIATPTGPSTLPPDVERGHD